MCRSSTKHHMPGTRCQLSMTSSVYVLYRVNVSTACTWYVCHYSYYLRVLVVTKRGNIAIPGTRDIMHEVYHTRYYIQYHIRTQPENTRSSLIFAALKYAKKLCARRHSLRESRDRWLLRIHINHTCAGFGIIVQNFSASVFFFTYTRCTYICESGLRTDTGWNHASYDVINQPTISQFSSNPSLGAIGKGGDDAFSPVVWQFGQVLTTDITTVLILIRIIIQCFKASARATHFIFRCTDWYTR